MSLIVRRLGYGMVIKGYMGAWLQKGWNEVQRLSSPITRTLRLESIIWRKKN